MTTSIEVDKITRGLVKEAENLLRQKWESNRLLVDFLEFLNSKKIILAKYGCDVFTDPEEREHYSDELVFACGRGTYDKLNLVDCWAGIHPRAKFDLTIPVWFHQFRIVRFSDDNARKQEK